MKKTPLEDKLLKEASERVDQLGLDYGETEPVSDVSDSLAREYLEELELEKKYGDSTLEAGALGAARGLSLGLTDQALVKSGVYTQEELRELKKRNEIASLTGEIGATAASLLATGGASAAAKGLSLAGKGVQTASKLGTAAEKAFIAALSKEGKNSITRNIVKNSAAKSIGSAVEGAIYGTGQLISEDALGNAEINGENIIAAAGTGALLGAATAGIFEAPKALAPVAKKSAGVVKGKLGDSIDATFDILGYTPSARTQAKKNAKKFTEELPEWITKKGKLGHFTGSKKLKENIAEIREEAGIKIGDTMKKIDEVSFSNPTILPTNKEIYSKFAKNVDDNFIKVYENTPGFSSQLTPIKKIRDEYIELAKKPGTIKASEIHELRMKTDDLLKFDKEFGKFTLKDKAIYDLRFNMNEEISEIAKKASSLDSDKSFGSLFEDLIEANKDFSYASRILPHMEKKVEKEAAKRGIFNLTDLITGGAASFLDPSMVGLTIGAKKLLESDIRRRAQILSSIERQNKVVQNKIQSGIKEFLNNKKSVFKSSATKSIISSNLSISSETKKRPKTEKEAFKNIKENLTEIITNPENLQKTIAKRTVHLNNIAPNTTNFATQTALRGVQFLQSKMPKMTVKNELHNSFTKREFIPSDLQLSKFERYLKAVENPTSVIEELKAGTLTREAAEAIQIVYPQMFKQIQENVIENMQSMENPLDYSKRLQLGILLNIQTDSSLQNANIASLQQNLLIQEEQQPGGPTAARADKINMAERRETKENRVAQR